MTYIKLSEPPEELRVLIDAFNAIPSDRNYRELEDKAAADYVARLSELFHDSQKEYLEAAKRESIEDLTKITNKYAALKAALVTPEIQAAIDGNALWDAYRDIGNMVKERRLLWDIVGAFWELRGQGFHIRDEVKGSPFFFREDGTLTPASRILNIFSRMSPERVRFCKICSTIFWAKKSNAWTCSPDCAAKLGNLKRLAKLKRKNPAATEIDDSDYKTI